MSRPMNIKDFYRKFEQASTPILKSQRQSRSRECIPSKQINITACSGNATQLLNSKNMWPLLFRTACQDHLNELQLQMNQEFLLVPDAKEKVRRFSPIVSERSRSRARDRSMSPCGARKMKESKWESKAEIAMLLIEEMLRCSEVWPATLLAHSQSNCEAKQLLEVVSNTAKNELKIVKIRERPINVIGQALRLLLPKIGVLLPTVISEQLGMLKSLITRSDGHLVRSRRHIEAVQTLLLNIQTTSRNLLQKLVAFYKIVGDSRRVNITESQLAAMLSSSLFEERENSEHLALCRDLILLSEKVFEAPSQLVVRIRNALNPRVENFVLERLIKPAKPPGTPKNLLTSYLFHTKTIVKPDTIVLTAVNKISSPEQLARSTPVRSALKRKSISEIRKQILEKSALPFRKSREYVISDFCAHKK